MRELFWSRCRSRKPSPDGGGGQGRGRSETVEVDEGDAREAVVRLESGGVEVEGIDRATCGNEGLL